MRDNEFQRSVEFQENHDPIKPEKEKEFIATTPEHPENKEKTFPETEYGSGAGERERFTKHRAGTQGKYKKNLLLQAAAVMTAVVVIESSGGVDILKNNPLGDIAEEVFVTPESEDDALSDDTLTEELENAGAKKGEITISMLWETTDDLDLHVVTPDGSHISYANKKAAGGELDVDMQNSSYAGNFAEHPVENVYFTEPQEGEYKVYIVNYSDRNNGDARALVRVSLRGRTKTYKIVLEDGEYSEDVCTFEYYRVKNGFDAGTSGLGSE